MSQSEDWAAIRKEMEAKIEEVEVIDSAYADRVFKEAGVAVDATNETRRVLDAKAQALLSVTVSVSTAILAIAMNAFKNHGIDAAFVTYAVSFAFMASATIAFALALAPADYEDKGFHVNELLHAPVLKDSKENGPRNWLYLALRLQSREISNRITNEARAQKIQIGIVCACLSPLVASIAFLFARFFLKI